MRMDCEAACEHLDAYALGALDSEDARALEAHLASCGECSRLADATEQDAALLGLAVPLRAAPSVLKARTLASAAILAEPRRFRRSRWWSAAAAALVAVSLAVVGWGAYMQAQVHHLDGQNASIGAHATEASSELAAVRTQLAETASVQEGVGDTLQTQQAVIDVMSQPDVRRTQLVGTQTAPSAGGRYLWSDAEQMGAFVGWSLPALPEGSVYRLWVIYEAQWVRGPAFGIDDQGRGQAIVRRLDASSAQRGELRGFAVTVEPALVPQTERSGAMVLTSFGR
jgi:anti-sigma factor RsiW